MGEEDDGGEKSGQQRGAEMGERLESLREVIKVSHLTAEGRKSKRQGEPVMNADMWRLRDEVGWRKGVRE